MKFIKKSMTKKTKMRLCKICNTVKEKKGIGFASKKSWVCPDCALQVKMFFRMFEG